MKAYSAVYVINIVLQSIFSLLFQVGACTLVAWLAVSKLDAPEWVYVPAVLFGVFTGIFTMIRFVISSMQALERLEKQKEGDNGQGPAR